MLQSEWYIFTRNAYNITYLKKYISIPRTIKTMIHELQYNLVIIKMHVTKNNIMLPEIWNIIFGYITYTIKKYNPKNFAAVTPNSFKLEISPVKKYDLTRYFCSDDNTTIKEKGITLLDKIKKGQLCYRTSCNDSYRYFIIVDINLIDRTIIFCEDSYFHCTSYSFNSQNTPNLYLNSDQNLIVQTCEDFIMQFDCGVHIYICELYYSQVCEFARSKYPYFYN